MEARTIWFVLSICLSVPQATTRWFVSIPFFSQNNDGFATRAVVQTFLHARKVGLLTMEWQYVCPGCGQIIERLSSLTSAAAHAFCQVCSAVQDADLSDFVEVTFSVAPEVRRSRYHDPWSLDPDEHFFNYRFTQSAVVDDGSPLRDHLRRCAVVCTYVEPRTMQAFQLVAKPRFLWLTSGPALVVGGARTDECQMFALEYTGARSKGFRADIAAGPVRIEFKNATDERYALMITDLPDHYALTMTPFLSGTQLLSNQTFRELFGAETITSGAKSSRSMRAGIGGENENRACRDDRHTERQHGDRVGGRGWRSWCVVGFSSGDCGPRSNHFNGLPSGRPVLLWLGYIPRPNGPNQLNRRASEGATARVQTEW